LDLVIAQGDFAPIHFRLSLSANWKDIRQQSNAGITRRPASLQEFDSQRVGGRVHAVVRRIFKP